MTLAAFWEQFINGLKATTWLEGIAVVSGISGVLLERKESIWLYPVGLIGTIIFVYLSLNRGLLGEASVNVYYTILSLYGWWLWARKKTDNQAVEIQYSTRREWIVQLSFFTGMFVVLYAALHYAGSNFYEGVWPFWDGLASAAAYTGMWMLAKKKIETWYWWLLTNTLSIPIYFGKGYVFIAIQFVVFTLLSISGLLAWRKKMKISMCEKAMR